MEVVAEGLVVGGVHFLEALTLGVAAILPLVVLKLVATVALAEPKVVTTNSEVGATKSEEAAVPLMAAWEEVAIRQLIAVNLAKEMMVIY